MKLILQIALGVSLGIVLGGSLLHLYTGAFTEQLISAALKQAAVQNAPAITPKTSTVDDLLAGKTAAITAQTVAATPQQTNTTPTQPAPIAEIKLAGKETSNPAATADAEEQRQKAIKFKAYYQKSDKCVSPNENHDLLVACGNEYIRAKAKFDELWQQGKFKN